MVNGMVSTSVLVLNQNYHPLNVYNVGRAVVLLDRGKAELLINGHDEVHTTAIVPSTIGHPTVVPGT